MPSAAASSSTITYIPSPNPVLPVVESPGPLHETTSLASSSSAIDCACESLFEDDSTQTSGLELLPPPRPFAGSCRDRPCISPPRPTKRSQPTKAQPTSWLQPGACFSGIQAYQPATALCPYRDIRTPINDATISSRRPHVPSAHVQRSESTGGRLSAGQLPLLFEAASSGQTSLGAAQSSINPELLPILHHLDQGSVPASLLEAYTATMQHLSSSTSMPPEPPRPIDFASTAGSNASSSSLRETTQTQLYDWLIQPHREQWNVSLFVSRVQWELGCCEGFMRA